MASMIQLTSTHTPPQTDDDPNCSKKELLLRVAKVGIIILSPISFAYLALTNDFFSPLGACSVVVLSAAQLRLISAIVNKIIDLWSFLSKQ